MRSGTFLWEVSSAKGKAHLLGSLHLARPEIYPLDERIEEAFRASDVLAVEADVAGMGGRIRELLSRWSHYADGETLSRRLAPETLRKLQGAGVDIATVDRMRPWYLAMTLQLKLLNELGFEQHLGIDLHFLSRAGRAGMRIVELEGVERQVQLLSRLTDGEELFLDYILEELDATRQQAEQLFRAWLNGDATAVEELIGRTFLHHPEFTPLHELLFLERNRDMAERVHELMERGERPFAVMGAGHLVGRGSVPELLSAMACMVRQR